ncbi:adenylyl-sulfate kinase [Pseudomonas fluorescens]
MHGCIEAKGLYRKARSVSLTNFTGISSRYTAGIRFNYR